MIVCVTEQGAKIRREDQTLVVEGKELPTRLFPAQIEQLLLYGSIHLTAQARYLLLRENIDTVFLRQDGSYLGRLHTEAGENVFLRQKQFIAASNPEFCLKIARAIVDAKIHNQRSFLGRLGREHGLADNDKAVAELAELRRKLAQAENLDSCRGYEGAASAIYFQQFRKAFHEDYGFTHRARRPPPDPVNAALSFAYSLLENRCHAACRIAGLDPAPSALHPPEYGRHSLPLDLMEEFRVKIADALVLALFNKHMLGSADFEAEPKGDGSQAEAGADAAIKGVYLKKDAMKKVIRAFAHKLGENSTPAGFMKPVGHGDAILEQARRYRRHIEGELECYAPLHFR